MLTDLGIQGTTAKNIWYDPGALTASCGANYVSDTGGSGIRINGDDLLTNKLTCADPYCLDAGSWQSYEPKITLDEGLVNQIAADVAKNIIKQTDPIEKNSDVDDVEVPPMSGFIEI